MRADTVIFLLSLCIVLLVLVVIYQRFCFRTGIQAKLKEISKKLECILDTNSDEEIMVFTDDRVLQGLAAQINRLLESRRKAKADYRRSQIASKKMLSNVSHDIKTPMTVILGYLEIIRLNGDPAQEMLLKVEAKAQRVMELIGQFFTLAKLEAGDMNMELSRININEACRENILDFYELLSQREFTVDIDIPEQTIYAGADREALQRIMFNLISNAVRYGADGKYLGVSLRTDRTKVYIDITDRGRGISPEYADTVFERLFTMEDSRNSQMQGNGLGLTIAKNLAMQMGGDITLESQPHIRTVFTVILKKYPIKL